MSEQRFGDSVARANAHACELLRKLEAIGLGKDWSNVTYMGTPKGRNPLQEMWEAYTKTVCDDRVLPPLTPLEEVVAEEDRRMIELITRLGP